VPPGGGGIALGRSWGGATEVEVLSWGGLGEGMTECGLGKRKKEYNRWRRTSHIWFGLVWFVKHIVFEFLVLLLPSVLHSLSPVAPIRLVPLRAKEWRKREDSTPVSLGIEINPGLILPVFKIKTLLSPAKLGMGLPNPNPGWHVLRRKVGHGAYTGEKLEICVCTEEIVAVRDTLTEEQKFLLTFCSKKDGANPISKSLNESPRSSIFGTHRAVPNPLNTKDTKDTQHENQKQIHPSPRGHDAERMGRVGAWDAFYFDSFVDSLSTFDSLSSFDSYSK
ncbi:hypothetical protein F5876DRAFT_67191, partial [Lentinula aff. lateritia]